MLTYVHTFINMLFISIVALFPVINPIGSALIVNPYLSQLPDSDKKAAVKKITIYAFSICVVALFAGRWILELFGISIPVVQLAGGIVICIIGWESLSARSDTKTDAKDVESLTNNNIANNVNDKLFYPITFPITTGAGTISVLFTLSAHSSNSDWSGYLINNAAMLLAITVMCILIYFLYGHTKNIVSRLGNEGQTIANRFIAFLIFCVGLQIAITGIKSLF
ncbi:MAG: MarC family protein [Ignavibacteriota bacterium]|nr:MarC family protein [Ignavibacteriota bacterium]MCO6446394.1 MarC family protein [Ignavibacterium album]MCZ2269472.1 MarC family protein [Ignavibacteriales bacterium]HMN16976.1 MarC family protein [Ignavibacteriaceae bacterium]QKK00358.1 MAG: MarC family protein [Ignavibacteriota bacterium]